MSFDSCHEEWCKILLQKLDPPRVDAQRLGTVRAEVVRMAARAAEARRTPVDRAHELLWTR